MPSPRGGNGLPPTFTRPVLLAGVCMIQGERGPERTLSPDGGEGRVRGAETQAFQPLIQSRSLEPAGFIAVLVETTSMGLMVTKS